MSPSTGTVERTQPHREGHVMGKKKETLVVVNGRVRFNSEANPGWEAKQVPGGPAYWRGKIDGVEVCLRDGLEPGDEIVGKIEVKKNTVTQSVPGGDEVSEYLYLNVFPLENEATATVSIVRPPKSGQGKDRVKVLPEDFNPETDYHVNRQGQPWQIVTVSAPAA